jgi:quinol monooxygenase YgiN
MLKVQRDERCPRPHAWGARLPEHSRVSVDPRSYIHSRWRDEAAFERHGDLPHTKLFVERVEAVIDHPLDVTRAERID